MLILALGNELRGDDAIGLILGRKLREKGYKVLLCYEAPQNFLGEIPEGEEILVIDSGEFYGKAGEFKVVSQVFGEKNTHKMDLDRLLRIKKPKKLIYFLIKPERTEIGKGVSEKLLKNVEIYVKEIERLIRREFQRKR